MANSVQPSGVGATPGKLILIAVLAVILVVVVAVQFGGGSKATPTCDSEQGNGSCTPQPPIEAPSTNARPSNVPRESQQATLRWPALELAEVSEYDPFARRPAVSSRRDSTATHDRDAAQASAARAQELARIRAEQDQFLQGLQTEGVKAVVGSTANGQVAVIGSQTVRVGDQVGGFRVIAIEPDGVVLERLSGE